MFCIIVTFSSCVSDDRLKYYSVSSNYIEVVGTVIQMNYNEENNALYLGFEELNPEFADSAFKIVGENLLIAQKNGIDQKIQIGKQIEFISAPRYFGDGYVMPIVGLSIDGDILLCFEQGYDNWLKWLEVDASRN